MSATIPSDHLAQQNKVVEVWLSSGKKKPKTKQKPSQLPTSLRCGFHHASVHFGLCFFARMAGEFLNAMVHTALFLKKK